jgi:NosR/NirI family transcriptional regulator, nitrous oxide reductase regulator
MSWVRRSALQLYRLAVLISIAWILRAHAVHMRVSGHAPLSVDEIRPVLSTAAELRDDPSERAGVFVHDANGAPIGYALRTAPFSDSIIGYRGSTDSLIVFDPALHVLGVRIRSSQDTVEHVGDVKGDPYYLKTWNGKPWDEVARTTPKAAGIEGVSGATLTSMAVAEAIQRRLLSASDAIAARPPPMRIRVRDMGLAVITLAGIVLAFTGTLGRPWLRRGFQILVIGYVGFLNGDLLAQSLIVGWVQNGIPWRLAPGLVLLLAAALAIPWSTGKPLYCHQLCPHGAAQELLHRIAPRRWRIRVRADLDRALRWLAPGLLGVVIAVAILGLPIDLAHLEPFDAYLLRAAGLVTASIAIVGLIASLFVPMAYCHYGCPTGALLTFIRSHRKSDTFSRRDIAALVLLALTFLLSHYHLPLTTWLFSIR